MTLHRPLDPVAQAEVEKALAAVKAMPRHLFTPMQWAEVAMRQAVAELGGADGAAKLAEYRRYLACQEAIARLAERCSALDAQLQTAHATIAVLERAGANQAN